MKRSIIFLILIGSSATCPAITVDSAKWPLPDSISIKFTVYGMFNSYHQVSDGNGHSDPNNYSRNEKGNYSTPDMIIVRTDSLLHYSDSTQTILYLKSYNTSPDNDTIAYVITLDTLMRRISTFTFHHTHLYSGIFGIEHEDISIKGLRYSQKNLMVEDSDISKDLISARYSVENKERPAGSSGRTLLSVDKVTISGSLNYSLLDVEPVIPQLTRPAIEYFMNGIKFILPETNHSMISCLYSSLGVIAQQVRIENGTAKFSTEKLGKGIYFVVAGNSVSKVMVW